MSNIPYLYLIIPFAPLLGALIAGLFGTGFLGNQVSRTGAHRITIGLMIVSTVCSMIALYDVAVNGFHFDGTLYTWAVLDDVKLEIGFLIDPLTAIMLVVVTFVSLWVHLYTIGYMVDDPGYQRFFAYISLFTFSMLMLVMSNNLIQLFFGWEAVGLVSYLLIGFWYKKPTAIFANLKAFLINRVGDLGFILGIGLIYAYTGTMHYGEIFKQIDQIAGLTFPGTDWQLVTVTCFCLFIGAMGKSAQVPLHAWLPDSMEGPTPISALIHAATMVTAGIFMVSRFSPMFELTDTVLSFIIIIGAIGAFFLGLVGVVQNDIKKVIAYSTLSQLGYMTVALGASAYPAAMFHLSTHACFKALLFLGAGSVIMGVHHNQDIRYMGGLRKYMPITWITFLIGTLALCGVPPFSGYFSKDHIIEAAAASNIWGAQFAYYLSLAGVFVTALYSFRLYFLVFEGKPRFDQLPHDETHDHGHEAEHHGPPHESPWVVTVALIMLAIPSIIQGMLEINPVLFGDYFKNVITVLPAHPAMQELAHDWHGVWNYIVHGFMTPVFGLVVAAFIISWYCYLINPAVPAVIERHLKLLNTILQNKYYFDWFNEQVLAKGARLIGEGLWKGGDRGVIDGIINGSAKLVGKISGVLSRGQSGYIYHYAFAMIIGLTSLITFFVLLHK
jgi:NADH-quinone oxidoreductase subunit L